jgi:hypothetical protein
MLLVCGSADVKEVKDAFIRTLAWRDWETARHRTGDHPIRSTSIYFAKNAKMSVLKLVWCSFGFAEQLWYVFAVIPVENKVSQSCVRPRCIPTRQWPWSLPGSCDWFIRWFECNDPTRQWLWSLPGSCDWFIRWFECNDPTLQWLWSLPGSCDWFIRWFDWSEVV